MDPLDQDPNPTAKNVPLYTTNSTSEYRQHLQQHMKPILLCNEVNNNFVELGHLKNTAATYANRMWTAGEYELSDIWRRSFFPAYTKKKPRSWFCSVRALEKPLLCLSL